MAHAPNLTGLSTIQQKVVETAHQYGIPPAKFLALVQRESGFNPQAVSNKGAQGLGQLMPGPAAGLGVRNSFDVAENLDASARYFLQQYHHFGDWDTATAAYIGGPGNVSAGQPFIARQNRYEQQWMGRLGSPAPTPTPQPAVSDTGLASLQQILGSPHLQTPDRSDTGLSSLQSVLKPSPVAETNPTSRPAADAGLDSLKSILGGTTNVPGNQPTGTPQPVMSAQGDTGLQSLQQILAQ